MICHRVSSVIAAAILLIASCPMWTQDNSTAQQPNEAQSIGDAINSADRARSAPLTPEAVSPQALELARTPTPIHIVYIHGINQVGAGDSLPLRKSICKYLGECTVKSLGRIYADGGPFSVNHDPPALAYMQRPIWKTKEDWNASAPFIDRYELSGNDHAPILLDEVNWWPIAYPLKCKWLIPQDARLTGPSKYQISVCAPPGGNLEDHDHPGRYLNYGWIKPGEANGLNRISRHATFANRSLKNGLMDWGFGDAVMALGPMQDILTAGIRQLLTQSLQATGIDLQTAKPDDAGPEFYFITHSLGSYLSLAALDSDWLGLQGPGLMEFAITPEEKKAVDYFSAHTASFFFLANQIELLNLARVSPPTTSPNPASDAPSETMKPKAISHWAEMRQSLLKRRSSSTPQPQIVAWSDPDDLLSWNVPRIEGVRVLNLHVRNSGFKILPFVVWPTGAHDNYVKNSKVLRVIFKPKQER